MHNTALEEMKGISAEILRKRGYTIENGIIREAGIRVVDGRAIVSVLIDTACGGTCSVGNIAAGQFRAECKQFRGTRYGFEALLWIMAATGVDNSSEIGGQYVRVAFDKDGRAACIGHIVQGVWLDFKMLEAGIHAEDDIKKERVFTLGGRPNSGPGSD